MLRRLLLRSATAALLLGLSACATAPAQAPGAAAEASRRAVELTFLKSTPGNRQNLKTYLTRNWLEMDRQAKAQGLMRDYTVVDTATDEGPWNVLVIVTYQNDQGYEGIAEAFEKIRAAHETVLVEGKKLSELGGIVESRQTFEN